MGQIERPFSLIGISFPENPAKHVVLQSIETRNASEYFALVQRKIADSANKAAFVFIHGYNVSFEDAARRTAQIAYDLKYDGAPTFFSWPSNANAMQYPIDSQNMEWSQPHIRDFIERLITSTNAEEIFLIGHSMGARGLANVVVQLVHAFGHGRRFRGLILSAPDIDADVFRTQIAPNIIGHTNFTLYASSDDFALTLSKSFNGHPRAGDAGNGLVTMPGLDTIDATGVDASFLGHSYFSNARTVISDIFYIVNGGLPPDRRHGLIREHDDAGQIYWRFQP
jgi:esterase/lipase superfamily enzyme